MNATVNNRRFAFGATFIMLAVASATCVRSQETTPSSPVVQTDGLQDIVVTAQRRSENLQKAAISVTAVSSDQLTRSSITTAANLTTAVPALQASNQAGFTTFYIRGIGSEAYNAYTEPAVAFNLNGVYISRTNGVNGQFFDLERVEVLKGPQGTLYGRNATGGAVNVLARKPELGAFDGRLGVEYGNYGELLVDGAINVPLGENGAIRAAFQTENHGGYYRDGTDDADSKSFRLSMRGQLTPDVSVNIVGDYSKLGGKGGGAATLPFGATTPVRGGLGDPAVDALFRNQFANTAIFPGASVPLPVYLDRLDTKTGGVLADITVRTPIGSLTILPAYRELDTNNFSTTPGIWISDRTRQHQTSVEARLASDGQHRLKYLLGGYYFNEGSQFLQQADVQFIGVVVEQGVISVETAAAFSQLSYEITDAIRLTGGVRYTWERKGLNGTHGLAPPAVFTSGPGLNPLVVGPAPPLIVVDGSRTFKSTTWKIGAEWDVGPRSLVYANVGTGFKAGGFFFAQDRNTYEPEQVTSYVLGTKNRFLDNRLQFNVEGFLLKYRNQQLVHPRFVAGINGPVNAFPTDNVGSSTIYGAEADLEYLATPTLLLGLDVNYVHTRADSYVYNNPDISTLVGLPAATLPPNTGCPSTYANGIYRVDCSGFPLNQTPTWSLNGHVQKTVDLANGAAVIFEIRSRYETSRYLNVSLLPITRVGDNTQSDLNLTYRASNKAWSATAYVNNIESKDVAANIFLHDAYPVIPLTFATLRPPRTYGLRAQVDF